MVFYIIFLSKFKTLVLPEYLAWQNVFGIPQNGERIYIVGFDKNAVKNYMDFIMPTPPCTPTNLGMILDEHVDEKYIISDTWTSKTKDGA